MSALVKAALAESLASVDRVVDTPTGDLGYGSDLSCTSDLAEDMAETDPTSPRGIAERIVRRLDTERGSLPATGSNVDDLNWGLDLKAELNRGQTTGDLQSLVSRIRAEVVDEDRVSAAIVRVELASGGKEMAVRVRVVPKDRSLGPFDLTLAVTSSAVLLEAIS